MVEVETGYAKMVTQSLYMLYTYSGAYSSTMTPTSTPSAKAVIATTVKAIT